MRIIIDMQGAQTGSRYRGIGRYTVSFVKEIIKNHTHHDYVLLLNGLFKDTIVPIRREFSHLIDQNKIQVWEAVAPVSEMHEENRWRRNAAELIRENFIENIDPDLILLTTIIEGYGDNFVANIRETNNNIPIALIFYDIIPYLYPEEYLTDKRVANWYEEKLKQIKRADLLLSISNSSRQEAIKYLGIKPDDVVNISAASDDRFFKKIISESEKNSLLNRFGLIKPYLMYLSATDWRKNHKRLIEAYSLLPTSIRNEHQLCFVGGLPIDHKNDFISFANECGLSNEEIIITNHVTDEEINALYNLCKAFIFPSWHEGFGLPVLEAMQCGKPVICSNTSSLPEIVEIQEALFDPFNIKDMHRKIEQVLTNENFRMELENNAINRSKSFSWCESAKTAIEAIERKFIQVHYSASNQPTTQHERTSALIKKLTSFRHPVSNKDILLTAKAIAINEIIYNQQRRLFVDISELVLYDSKTGIQRVVRNILRQWLDCPSQDIKIVPVYASMEHGYKYANSFIHKFMDNEKLNKNTSESNDDIIDFKSGDIFLGLDLLHPDVIEKHEAFYQMLRRHNVSVKFVLYDMLPIQLPQYSNAGVPEGFKRWLTVVVSNADEIICISNSVADDLKTYLHKHAYQYVNINWFHLGADIKNEINLKILDLNYSFALNQISKLPSFLMVGTLEPRKGHVQVLEAFEQLWQSFEINLVLVGKLGWKMAAFVDRLQKHPQKDKHLFWFDSIDDYSLDNIYYNCTCLIAASYGEGFGLPIIEAAQHKVPIIARDIHVFREVAGEHAYYFMDSNDPEVIAQTVKEWLILYQNGKHSSPEGMQWLTWKQSAENLLKILVEKKKPYHTWLKIKKIGIVIVTYSMAPHSLIESIMSKHHLKYYVFHHGNEDVGNEVKNIFSKHNSEVFLSCGNRGLAKSWNEGIYLSKKEDNDITLVINDDIEFYHECFDSWVSFIIEHPEAALVFCYGDETQSDSSIISRSQDFACFAFGNDAYYKVGKFDEIFVPAYFEDFDYMSRCSRVGVSTICDPSVRCRHERSHTVRSCPEIAKNNTVFFSENKTRFINKWGWHEPNSEKMYIYPYNDPINTYYDPF